MFESNQFWQWIIFNEGRLKIKNQPHYQALFNQALRLLQQYNNKLWLEIHHDFDTNIMLITAEGDAKEFESADNLISEAPTIEGWIFKCLKPGKGFDNNYYLGLNPSEMKFKAIGNWEEPGPIGLKIFIKDFEKKNKQQYLNKVYQLIYRALGERCTGEKILYLDVDKFDCDSKNLKSLLLLGKEIKEYVN